MEDKKDFKSWMGLKSKTHFTNKITFFKEGEVWWVALGENVGVEEYAVLAQIRMMSAARLYDRMGYLSKGDFQKVKEAFKKFVD